LSPGVWEFRFSALDYKSIKDNTITFDSIGELNCVSGSFNVRQEFAYTLRPAHCPTTTSGSIVLGIVVLFSMFLILTGLAFRLRFMGILGGTLLIPLSWVLVACHAFTGYVCMGAGLLLVIWFALKK